MNTPTQSELASVPKGQNLSMKISLVMQDHIKALLASAPQLTLRHRYQIALHPSKSEVPPWRVDQRLLIAKCLLNYKAIKADAIVHPKK